MVSDRKVGDAVGGISVRACDNCARRRARWYCAADDAFLCESCDSTVHSANPLARRHERVRLNTASRSATNSSDDEVLNKASWHQGFTRKPRTPRQKKIGNHIPLHLVPEPEVCSEEENEEQLLYRVPVFDPTNTTAGENSRRGRFGNIESSNELQFQEILPSELELAEFAADVESLLGKGLEDESFDMEGLGIFDGELEANDCCWLSGKIKAEDGEVFDENRQIDFQQINFEQEHRIPNQEASECKLDDSNKAFLKLNYERVMSAWDDNKSPWTTGDRPALTSADCWTDCCIGTSGGAMHAYGEVAMRNGQTAAAAIRGDGGREARVSRYREKRRTRLFSKKIRYEVRKLNAEKRPRMKGRFVKRASFAASGFPLLHK